MKATGRVVAVLLCLSVAVACRASRSQRVCGILYTESVSAGETTHLRLIEPGSGVEHTLLTSQEALFNGGLSPDATKVFYTRRDAAGWGDTWIMPLDGSRARPLLTSAAPHPSGGTGWSFDGHRAAFRTSAEGGSYPSTDEYYVVDVATGTASRLPVRGWACAWSPTDNRIAILCSFGDDWGVWIIDTETSETRRLLAGMDMREPALAWSPDGKEIAVVAGWGAEYVYVVDVARGIGRAVTRTDGVEHRLIRGLLWSPEGDKIAFATNDTSGGTSLWCTDLYVVDLMTGEETKLAERLWAGITWSPDGSEIAFEGPTGDEPCCSIYKVDVSTAEVTQLTDGPEEYGILAWDCVTLVAEEGR